jgi:hypothetical protein
MARAAPAFTCARLTVTGAAAGRLVESQHQVGVLHRLPGGALDQVVDRGGRDHRLAGLVDPHRHLAAVSAAGGLRPRHLDLLDERLVRVVVVVQGGRRLLVEGPGQPPVRGYQQPPGERRQMRGEGDGHRGAVKRRQLGLDLGLVMVANRRVGRDPLRRLAEAVRLGQPFARTGDAGLAVDDHVRVDHPLGHQRCQGEDRGGGIAARVRHGRRSGDGIAMQLGQSVGPLEPHVGGQVHDRHTRTGQLPTELAGGAMG